GNSAETLSRCRSPFILQELLHKEGLPYLRVLDRVRDIPTLGRWLVKPLAGAGGSRIAFVPGDRASFQETSGCYFQEFAEGDARAAIYVGDARNAYLVGVTRQLIGCSWLNAASFHYCGS